jgi:hypothetical protein
MTRRRRGTDLGNALAGLAAKLDRKSGGALIQAQVSRAWQSVAGPSVNAHTTGAHMRDKELVVYVDSPLWAAELSALAGPYVTALNKEIGHDAVRAVRFSVSRRVQQEQAVRSDEEAAERAYREDDVPSVPLTQAELDQVEASAAGIADDELREAVVRATVADLEWKKGLEAAKSREEPREGV